MPIRPDLRHFYRGPKWKAAREACRESAGDRCENCGAPNHVVVLRAYAYWTPATIEATVFMARGRFDGKEITTLPWHYRDIVRVAHFPRHDGMKWVGIQCGAAHLNNVAGDDRPENLAWLCRGCHLHLDADFHRLTRATRKDRARPIIRKATEPYQLTVDDALKELQPQLDGLDAMKSAFKKVFGRNL